jgi:hypothetical protein
MLITYAIALVCCAAEPDLAAASPDPLTALPVLIAPAPTAAAAPDLPALFPAIHAPLRGVLVVDRGPSDGLEVVACLDGGKVHEALVRLEAGNGQLLKAAFIATLGLDRDGSPAEEATGQPARGWPVAVDIVWDDPDGGGWRTIAASSLVRDRTMDRPYPPLPFLYTGSRPITERQADGSDVVRGLAVDDTKSVVVAYDEPDALLASPFPGSDTDHRFETYSAVCPPAGTSVWVLFRRAALPLTLRADAAGALAEDDAALAAALAAAYGPGSTPAFRAVAITMPAQAPRDADRAVRARVLAAAAAGGAWVVPVFVPAS